ncbi:MAG TPA: flagellar biosynthesis [Desulfotomaculum sp.]|nr:flagellar biosynthesis [Desulfotomaculum sp.]
MKKETKKKELAAALRYKQNKDKAPVVVASGQGELAQKIKEIAQEHKIPVYQDEALAKTLVKLGVQVEIPPELYAAVAQVLVYVYQLDQKAGK